MANGIIIVTEDGSEVHLPEEVAREAYPDLYAGTPVPDTALPSGPSGGSGEITVEPQPASFRAEWDAAAPTDPGSEANPYTYTIDEAQRLEEAAQLRQDRYADRLPLNVGVTDSVPPIPRTPGQFVPPVANPRVTPHGAFGVPREGGARSHQGVDYAGKEGEPVLALGPGVVTRVGPTVGDGGKGGNRVEIDYGNGRVSSSMHLSRMDVKPGDKVEAGQVIGAVGRTGTSSSGPHLHQKYMVDGKPVDESEFLGSQRGGLAPSTPSVSAGQGYSYSGYAPGDAGQGQYLDAQSIGQNYEPFMGSIGQNSALAEDAARFDAQAQLDANAALQPYQDVRTQLALEAQQAEADRAQAAQRALAEHNVRIQEAVAAVPHENPGRYWHNLSGFDQGMATMTLMMGGLQGMKTGGPNHVANFALEIVDRDMRAQEQEIATAKAKVGYAQDAYERSSRQSYYDKLDLQEMKALKLETLAAAMEQEAAKYKSQFTQARFLQTVAQLRVERDNLLLGVQKERVGQMQQALTTNAHLQRQDLDRQQRERHFSISESNRVAAAQAQSKANAPRGLLVGRATGFNRSGESFEVPGISDADRAKNHEEFRRRAQGASTALGALRDLKGMTYEKLSSMSPEDRTRFQAAMAQVVLGQAEASGYSVSKSSDKDMEMFKAAAGGDMTIARGLFDSDGAVRKEVISNAIDDIVGAQNMFAQSWGDESIKYDPPAWASELRTNSKRPEDALADLAYGPAVIPGASNAGGISAQLGGAEVVLKHARKGYYDARPDYIVQAADGLVDYASQLEKQAPGAEGISELRAKAVELREVASERASAVEEERKRTSVPATTRRSGLSNTPGF